MPESIDRASSSFKYTLNVEVRTPEFEPFTSVSFLDTGRLAKGNHKIEIGFVKSGCGNKLVRALIAGGMVTDIEVEPCENTIPAPPDLLALVEEARRHLAGTETKFQPLPISELMTHVAQRIKTTNRCVTICVFGTCYQCCSAPISGGGGTIEVCGSFPDRRL